MSAGVQTHVAFHLTGRRPPADLGAVDRSELQPALFSRYRDLAALRYDFPVVLAGTGGTLAESLSGACDRVLRDIAHGEDGERVSRHVLRIEREIRQDVARGRRGLLSALWSDAAARLTARDGGLVADSLARAAAALHLDGEVVECDADFPAHLLAHAWSLVQARKASVFRRDVDALLRQLDDILRADATYSAAGCRPERLRETVGGADAESIDFDALSRVLLTAAPAATLTDERRRRIESIAATLESQDFYPATAFTFNRPSVALHAYRERLPKVAMMARAIAVAELEASHAYREDRHDALFDPHAPTAVDARDLAAFPDSFVVVNARDLDPAEQAALLEILAAGLPIKVLLQWDDLLEESTSGDGHLAISPTARQLGTLAMGTSDTFVLQATSSSLYQMRDQVMAGMAFRGPALFNVYSGAGGQMGGLPPYLAAAAALESRAFPCFTCDPSAGSDWGTRLSIDHNPQPDADWPVHELTSENAQLQRSVDTVAFTVADFIACDARGARHLARVPPGEPASAFLRIDDAAAAAPGAPGPIPALMMIDRALTLQRVLVDERLLRETRRCRELWRSLQALSRAGAAKPTPTAVSEPALAPPALASPAAPPAEPAADVPAHTPGDAYIETPRCSTCNECTRINNRMFAYNENRQAFIKDPDAGTFAELVEAAESCQLSIIHPGKPRNPNEPGLDELVRRAEPFQ